MNRIEEWLGDRVVLCGEMGCNHQGQPEIAHSTLVMAHKFGLDLVKGQVRDLDSHPDWKDQCYNGPASFGETYWEHRQALELPIEAHLNLRHAARARGMDYSVSVWDVRAARRVVAVAGWHWLKVPSACLTDLELIETLIDSDTVLVVSTGMSTRMEIDNAVALLERKAAGRYMLLVCTSTYPCRNEDVHLRRLETMREAYGVPIGISGHWPGVQIDAAAVALGARMIERHITLDRTMRGSDHAASVGPRGVELLVRDARVVEAALGRGDIGALECEDECRRKLRGEP